MSRFEDPVPQFLDNAGDPIPGGKLFFYESGTSTPKATYADASQTIANTNPVILSASGRVGNVFYDGLARVVLKDEDDAQVWDRDPVGSSQIAGSIADWSSIATYGTNDIVRSGDGVYQSLQSNNINKDPATNSDYWEEVRFIQVWNTNVTYMEDDIVQRGGFFYRSKTDSNIGNDPVGDTTNWGGTQSTDIADGSITLVKMEDMSQNEIIGRATTGNGSPEHLTAAQTRAVLNVADGATANQTDAYLLARANHTGTQTLSTISDAGNLAGLDTVTLALVTDSGDLAALNTVSGTEIDDDSITLAKMAAGTAGNLITYDAAGDPSAVATGTSGQFLGSNGLGAVPTMQLVPGSIVQTEFATDSTLQLATTIIPHDNTIPAVTEGDQILSQSFTMSSTANKIRVQVSIPVVSISNFNIAATVVLFKGSTAVRSGVFVQSQLDDNLSPTFYMDYEEVVGSTSPITWSVRVGPESAATVYINGDSTGSHLYGASSFASLAMQELRV